ncbi:hypothetical protein [Leptolyngbya ohadii]|uniref:hypothetical protein n=1 Tax=Leptolyngbya ohadii TaxID=1962290 RepID=UPI0019D4A6F5|nr:hypothetical protein [Leptolyngbya ohadii]
MLNRSPLLMGITGAIVAWSGLPGSIALATPNQTRQSEIAASTYIRPRTACPAQLEELISRLLRDLPSYANRVNQRVALPNPPAGNLTDESSYVLLAGLPEYEPLTLGPGAYLPESEGGSDTENSGIENSDTEDVSQAFFTTLERRYSGDRTITLQVFHWLFLTQTRVGWRLVLMQSAIGQSPRTNPEPTDPPYDSSNGVIAQAIRLWLRDCEAGSVEE